MPANNKATKTFTAMKKTELPIVKSTTDSTNFNTDTPRIAPITENIIRNILFNIIFS